MRALYQTGQAIQLESDDDGDNGDGKSIKKKGKDRRAFGKVWFDIDIDVFGNGLIPSKSGDKT